MAIPADLLSETKGQDRVFAVVELILAGTTFRYAPRGAVGSDSLGLFTPDLLSVSGLSRVGNTTEFVPEINSTTIVVADRDRSLQKVLAGPARLSVRGSQALIKLVSPVASSWELFNGKIRDYGIESGAQRAYRFELQPDLALIEGPSTLRRVTREQFPSAPDANIGKPLHIIYGINRSDSKTGDSGMLPTVMFGRRSGSNYPWYFANFNQNTTIERVWVNGTESTLGSGSGQYTVSAATFGKDRVTFIEIIDATLDETDTVTWDGEGDKDWKNVSFDLTNPAKILLIYLRDWVFGDGASSLPDETSQPIDATSFNNAADFFDDIGAQASLYTTADESGIEVVARMCADWGMIPYFTFDNKIAVAVEDSGVTSLDPGESRHFSQSVGSLLEFLGMDTSRSEEITKIDVSHRLNKATGSYVNNTILQVVDATTVIEEEVQYSTSKAFS